MKTRHTSKSSLFLMELIIAVLFFALASSICTQLFVKAHTINRDSTALNHSVQISQNLSESFYACDGDFSAIANLFADELIISENSPKEFLLAYDSQFHPLSVNNQNALADAAACRYLVSFVITDSSPYIIADIHTYDINQGYAAYLENSDTSQSIYSLQLKLLPAHTTLSSSETTIKENSADE